MSRILLNTPTPAKAASLSAAVHLGTLAAVWAWSFLAVAPRQPPEFSGRRAVIQLQASWTPTEPPSVVAVLSVEPQVVVMPMSATIAQRRFRQQVVALAPRAIEAPPFEPHRSPPPMQIARAAVSENVRINRQPDPPPVAVVRQAPLPADRRATPLAAASAPGTLDHTPPVFSGNRPPVYPAEAVRRGLSGVVVLQVSITATGWVDEVRLLQSSGHAILDAAAVGAVRQWRGVPAHRDGRPVATLEVLPVRFQLPQ